LDRSAFSRYAVAAAAFGACALVSFQLNDIAEALHREFPSVFRSAEDVLQGRYSFSTAMESYIDTHATPVTTLFGFGPQSMRTIVGDEYFGTDKFLVHNDYLYVNFEFGA